MTKETLQHSCLERGLKHCGFHICVLGTIGSGKTTLAKALQKVIEQEEGQCHGFYEPVSTNPLLPLYYQDPNRYALAMQIYMLNKRYEQQRVVQDLALEGISSVQDSSIYGDSCFVEMLFKDGILKQEEVDVYSELFLNMTRDVMYPSLVVYLNCEPEVALSRIKKRGRDCETGIPATYLKNLNNEIKMLCDEFSRFTYVKEIDANEDLTETQIELLAINIYRIANFWRKNPILTRQGV